MSYIAKLDTWYREARERGEVLDVKFIPGTDPNADPEEVARLMCELLTGQLETEPLDTSTL